MTYNATVCRDLLDTGGDAVGSHLWPHHSTSALVDMIPSLGYKNGQLAVHQLGQQRGSSQATASLVGELWEMPHAAAGTLESVVDLATHRKGLTAVPAAATDSLVPCEKSANEEKQSQGMSTCSARKSSGSEGFVPKKLERLETRVTRGGEYYWPSASGSFGGGDICHVAMVDTCQKEESSEFGLATTPFCSDTTMPLSLLSRPQTEEEKKGISASAGASAKSTLSTKRRRDAATTHNQSERKRRDTINQKMKMLHKLVPNSTKTDKASILDEVIDYLKKLQSQHMMMVSRLSMASMNMTMMPLAMLHPLMSMMPPMVMDMNIINPMTCPNPPALSPLAFIPMASWNAATTADRLASPATMVPPDPTFFAGCHSQPLSTMETYSEMVSLIQQQQLGSTSKINWNL